MKDFEIDSVTVSLPAWVNRDMGEVQLEEDLKDALFAIKRVSSVSLYIGGQVVIDGGLDGLQAVIAQVASVCREHASNPPKLESQGTLPFMLLASGEVKICDGVSGEAFEDGWTGICCAANDVKSLWYIGSSGGERTFSKLRSKTLDAAVIESKGVREVELAESNEAARSAIGRRDVVVDVLGGQGAGKADEGPGVVC